MANTSPELLQQGLAQERDLERDSSNACAHWNYFKHQTSCPFHFQHSPSCRFDNKHSRVRSTLSGPCPRTSARRWTTWCCLESVGVACGGGRFCKRTGVLFIHCGTPSCRCLLSRSAHRVCTFAGLPHQHWENSRQNNQLSLSANMPHCIAVFVSDCLRHSVVNITMSRLSSLVSSCLDAGSTATHMLWNGGGGTYYFACREGEQQGNSPSSF